MSSSFIIRINFKFKELSYCTAKDTKRPISWGGNRVSKSFIRFVLTRFENGTILMLRIQSRSSYIYLFQLNYLQKMGCTYHTNILKEIIKAPLDASK